MNKFARARVILLKDRLTKIATSKLAAAKQPVDKPAASTTPKVTLSSILSKKQ